MYLKQLAFSKAADSAFTVLYTTLLYKTRVERGKIGIFVFCVLSKVEDNAP